MKPTSVLAAILIFAAGAGSGWWLSHYYDRPDAGSPFVPPIAEPVEHQEMRVRAAANVQWLSVEAEEHTRSVPAVVLKDRGIMIASLYQVFPSQRITLRQRGSDTTVMPQVIAASRQIPLIALSWHGSRTTGFELSNDSGSLYLGKEALLRLPNERIPAIIQSALVRDDRGVESFSVQLTRETSHQDGPLIDSDNEQLIGYVAAARTIPGQTPPPLRAVDALQITTLLDNYRFPEALGAGAFNRYWSDSEDGLRLAAEQAFATGNWMRAYDAATRLYGKATDFSDQDQRLLTTAAYHYALDRIDNGDTGTAVEISAAMRPNYPDAQPWCLVDARANAYHQSWHDALRHLGHCLDQSSHFYSDASPRSGRTEGDGVLLALYRDWVMQLASDPEQATTDKVAALQSALDREPDAHLYRTLADIQYAARMYSRAQRNYELAIAMDPGLATELAPRLQTSQQRTDSVPLAEIPFESRRGAIIVNGRLNNSTQNFRLMVDTGATYCALSRATLLRLGLHDVFNRGAPVIELESAAGPIYAQRFDLDSMALGPARVNNVPVVLLENLEGVDGLVGLSFLRHFGVAIDQQAGKLILTRL